MKVNTMQGFKGVILCRTLLHSTVNMDLKSAFQRSHAVPSFDCWGSTESLLKAPIGPRAPNIWHMPHEFLGVFQALLHTVEASDTKLEKAAIAVSRRPWAVVGSTRRKSRLCLPSSASFSPLDLSRVDLDLPEASSPPRTCGHLL